MPLFVLVSSILSNFIFHLSNFIILYKDIDEGAVFERPNIYCHFAGGIGEPKYMPVANWEQLNKLLTEALSSYNDLIAAMNLVLFEDAMMHICRYEYVVIGYDYL